jgi:predicted AAA+ superfamily ATPase
LKVQEKLQEKDTRRVDFSDHFTFDDDTNEYEKLLRKLESDIRTYIKVE